MGDKKVTTGAGLASLLGLIVASVVGWVSYAIWSSLGLTIAGGVMDVLGASVLVIDVSLGVREYRRYLAGPRSMYLSGIASGAAFGNATLSGGREPSLEERLSFLETESKRLQESIAQLKEYMEDRIDSATRTVEAGARERGERLESLVSGALVGRARLQGFAAGLVSIGAVAATLGGALTLAAGGG